MITVEQALKQILASAEPLAPQRIPLGEAVGQVLAEDIVSDVDSPPHDKAMMDGYAVVAADLAGKPAELLVLEEVTAGMVPTQKVVPGTATRIMTGTPIPDGADAVVMVERTELAGGHEGRSTVVRVHEQDVRAGQHIMTRGTSLRRGEVVLSTGTAIRPMEVGILCEVGRTRVNVTSRPSVAVLATGNELVPPETVPIMGQIRNSNGPMLLALARRGGAAVTDLGIGQDSRADLRRLIEQGLKHDVLVLSGGVSAGVLDLVPAVLAELGVHQVFHKVRLKPGKPLWFGTITSGSHQRLVFGLPGNPVSSLVTFELFVRPALAKLAGHSDDGPIWRRARLSQQHQQHGDRPTYFPSRLEEGAEGAVVQPVLWHGSADLRSLSQANCLICFPAGDRIFAPGEHVDVRPL